MVSQHDAKLLLPTKFILYCTSLCSSRFSVIEYLLFIKSIYDHDITMVTCVDNKHTWVFQHAQWVES